MNRDQIPPSIGQYFVKARNPEGRIAAVIAVWDGSEWIAAKGLTPFWWDEKQPQRKKTSYDMQHDIFIIRHAGQLMAHEMAQKIGRTESSVKVRAHALGVSLAVDRPYAAWDSTDERYVIELVNAGFTPQDIADKLDRSRASIYSKIEALKGHGRLKR